MRHIEEANSWSQKAVQWLPEAKKRDNGLVFNRHRVSGGVMKKFWK